MQMELTGSMLLQQKTRSRV